MVVQSSCWSSCASSNSVKELPYHTVWLVLQQHVVGRTVGIPSHEDVRLHSPAGWGSPALVLAASALLVCSVHPLVDLGDVSSLIALSKLLMWDSRKLMWSCIVAMVRCWPPMTSWSFSTSRCAVCISAVGGNHSMVCVPSGCIVYLGIGSLNFMIKSNLSNNYYSIMGILAQDYFFIAATKNTLEMWDWWCYNYSSRGFRVCPEQPYGKNQPNRNQANSMSSL